MEILCVFKPLYDKNKRAVPFVSVSYTHLVYPAVAENGISVCLDVGHLVRYGHPVLEQMETCLLYTSLRHELRLNLVDAEADHQVRHDLRLGLRLADDADEMCIRDRTLAPRCGILCLCRT